MLIVCAFHYDCLCPNAHQPRETTNAIDAPKSLNNILKLSFIIIRNHTRSRQILFRRLIISSRRQLFLRIAVCHRIVTLHSLGFEFPGHGEIARLDQMRNHLQGLLEICLGLLQTSFESFKWPVFVLAERLVDEIEEFVLGHARGFVFLCARFGWFCCLLGMLV